MKKKFASFMVTGKAATLPFFAQQASAIDIPLEAFTSASPHVFELSVRDKVKLLDVIGNTNAIDARVCAGNNAMTVVVSGARNGDAVYLMGSSSSDGAWANIPGFNLGTGGFRFLTHFRVNQPGHEPMQGFTVGGGNLAGALNMISVPVDISMFPGNFFLQVAIIRNGAIIMSEMDIIERRASTAYCY